MERHPHSDDMRPARLALASALVSCSGSHDPGEQFPADALTPVDCGNLPPAPEDLVGEAMQSNAVRLEADLDFGQAQVLLGWSDGSDVARWLLPTPTQRATIVFGPGIDALPVWNVWIKIPCLPEAATHVQLIREGEKAPLTPGPYPIVSVSFDVPEREQSADIESMELSGEVIVTGASDDLVSGYMRGWGSGIVKSNLTQEDLGLRYKVAAMQFEDIPGDFVGDGE